VSALERRFKKHLKKTPHQYINEVRLDNARRLLRETDKPIGTIALETGFADHSHFTRAFTRRFGTAPSADRRSRNGLQPA
jgi:transcriptional regulator GlxA family with amidase domain